MDKQQIKELLYKYEAGTCTEEEKALLETWYLQWKPEYQTDLTEDLVENAVDRIWERLQAEKRGNKLRKLWPRVAAAVVILLCIGTGLYLYTAKKEEQPVVQLSRFGNDIAPGGNRAVLKLANGRMINLSEVKTGVTVHSEQLTYNDGTLIDRSLRKEEIVKDSLLEVSAPRGGQYQINLSDGTKVWLNAASSIKFPEAFTTSERRVEITGEAYFEVARDKHKPFYVRAGNQEVQVLGTRFNINAYKDEGAIKTTLVEGSINVFNISSQASQRLTPGEQSIVKGHSLTTGLANTLEAIAWKDGYFMFVDEPLESVMRKIARWYDVEIHYENGIPEKTFEGDISRFQHVSEILEVLEATGAIKFKIEGRRITVMQ